jgi:hypothetical protein
MQKLLYRFLFVCTLAGLSVLTSCKKESAGGTTEEKLVGKWTMEAAYFDYYFLGVSQKDTAANTTGNYIQFNADGTSSASDDGQVTAGTWKFTDNRLIVTENGDEDSPVGYDIVKINAHELQLHNKEIDGEDYVEINVHMKK